MVFPGFLSLFYTLTRNTHHHTKTTISSLMSNTTTTNDNNNNNNSTRYHEIDKEWLQDYYGKCNNLCYCAIIYFVITLLTIYVIC